MKYWKTHEFDPVNIKYFDNEKEDKFVIERAEEAKIHGKNQIEKLPISVKNEGMLYNPVNMKVDDEQRLYERDLREKNKKIRYEVRYDVEHDAHLRGLEEEERVKWMAINKMDPKKYTDHLERGFDILTNDPLQGKDAIRPTPIPVTQKREVKAWDKISSNCKC